SVIELPDLRAQVLRGREAGGEERNEDREYVPEFHGAPFTRCHRSGAATRLLLSNPLAGLGPAADRHQIARDEGLDHLAGAVGLRPRLCDPFVLAVREHLELDLAAC